MPINLLDSANVGRSSTPLITDVNLTLQRGRLVQLKGKNGVGKTTLIHSILGYNPLLSGQRGDGLPTPGTRKHQHYFGYLPASVPKLPALTHAQWMNALDAGFQLRKGKALEMWDRLGGRALPGNYLADLSSGNLRKALFVGAAVIPRDVLILDEPFDEVDAEGKAVIAEITNEQLAAGAAVLLVSHSSLPAGLAVDRELEISGERLHVRG